MRCKKRKRPVILTAVALCAVLVHWTGDDAICRVYGAEPETGVMTETADTAESAAGVMTETADAAESAAGVMTETADENGTAEETGKLQDYFRPVKDVDYYVEGVLSGAGEPWAGEEGRVRIAAAEGRSLQRAQDGNDTWAEELIFTEPQPVEDVTFYVRKEKTDEERNAGENEETDDTDPEGQTGIAAVRFGIEGEEAHTSCAAAGIRLAESADKQDEAGNPLYQSKTVPVHMTAGDSCSGLRRILWTVGGTKTFATIFPSHPGQAFKAGDIVDGWTVIESRGQTITSAERTVYIQGEGNAITVKMGIDDWAGHHTEGGQVCFSADQTAPQVTIGGSGSEEHKTDGEDPDSGEHETGGEDPDGGEHETGGEDPADGKEHGSGGENPDAGDRDVTVTVRDDNIGESVPEVITSGGQEQTGPWRQIDNVDGYETVVTIPSGGSGRVTVQASDRAGNMARISAPSGAGSGEKDSEIEEITVSGVKEGGVYRDFLTSDITIGDQNLEDGDVKIYRTLEDGREEEVTDLYLREIPSEENRKKLRVSNIDSTPVSDGIYRMEIRARDTAGNERTETVRFAVNNSGSRFAYSDDLNRLRGTYLQSVGGPVRITVYSPSALTPEMTEIEIMRDGVLLNDVHVERIDEKGSGDGWYRCTYVIGKENFRKDGLYQINVISIDGEGNHSQSALKSGPVAFTVDSVPPVISGVRISKEDGKYLLKYAVFDESGLKSVRVKDGGKTLNPGEDPGGRIRVEGSAEVPEELAAGPVVTEAEDLAGNLTRYTYPQIKAASGTGFVPGAAAGSGQERTGRKSSIQYQYPAAAAIMAAGLFEARRRARKRGRR